METWVASVFGCCDCSLILTKHHVMHLTPQMHASCTALKAPHASSCPPPNPWKALSFLLLCLFQDVPPWEAYSMHPRSPYDLVSKSSALFLPFSICWKPVQPTLRGKVITPHHLTWGRKITKFVDRFFFFFFRNWHFVGVQLTSHVVWVSGHSKAYPLYVCAHPFFFRCFSHVGSCRVLSRFPSATQ